MSRFPVAVVAAVLLLGAAPNRSTPASLVQSAYTWARTHNFASDTAGLQPFLTASLYGSLQKILRIDRCTRKADIDWDIFSGTQVGTYGFRVGAAVVHGDTATVPVTVSAGLSKSRAQDVAVEVIAQRVPGGWRIADIMTQAGRGYASLRQQLQYDTAHLRDWSSRFTPAQRRCVGPI
jgi:hypothetical protein